MSTFCSTREQKQQREQKEQRDVKHGQGYFKIDK